MKTANLDSSRDKTNDEPYRRIKVFTGKGNISTVSIDKTSYQGFIDKIGAPGVVKVVRRAAIKFDAAKTKQTRSAYVVQALRSSCGFESERSAATNKSKYTYAKFRVRDERGHITTVSLPQSLMARAKRKLTTEQIRDVIDTTAATYMRPAIFSRSESIQRALKKLIGERVPSEIQAVRRKFKLTNAELASLLQVSPAEIERWDSIGEIESGPARMMLVMLWRKELSLYVAKRRAQAS